MAKLFKNEQLKAVFESLGYEFEDMKQLIL